MTRDRKLVCVCVCASRPDRRPLMFVTSFRARVNLPSDRELLNHGQMGESGQSLGSEPFVIDCGHTTAVISGSRAAFFLSFFSFMHCIMTYLKRCTLIVRNRVLRRPAIVLRDSNGFVTFNVFFSASGRF